MYDSARMAVQTHEQQQAAPSLTEGSNLRCPNCEQLRDPMDSRELKRYERSEKYAQELNVVYQCIKKTGGCGHIFSPGDQRILIAFLQGDLVPAHPNPVNNGYKQEVIGEH